MNHPIHNELTEFYLQRNIHPEHFNCQHQSFCRRYAYQNDMTQTKMSMVGSRYGSIYPKIVVVSLDPPYGNSGDFVADYQRTTAYTAAKHEATDYTRNRPNPHWAVTQILVKDLLCLFGYQAQPGAAVMTESYAGRPLENVSACFAHVNVAKCSMNNPGKGQADKRVHRTCGNAYLREELSILAPDILVTQGNAANEVVVELLGREYAGASDLPAARQVEVGKRAALWLPMRHPARQLARIRQEWPFYVGAVLAWKGE
jgi:hypothetical protein